MYSGDSSPYFSLVTLVSSFILLIEIGGKEVRVCVVRCGEGGVW